ncbi:hypothetical protein [Actinomadura mexicana]|uniref:Mce-associated membrane protein n=1 Tax=Actinomadura mexicana TaxID=134959 RepID=A0A238UYC5_9ACTN|nr:hypothetical protein [Actinomadura mexicana]SNR26978.1 hypothetical protein SAMN06265355_101601 [Actinomadura mexicana]
MTVVAAVLRKPTWMIRWIRPAGHALTAAAAVLLLLSLWSLLQSGRGADHDLATARDDVSRTAVRDLVLINSIDPKVAELDMTHWLDVATGPFADALKRDMPGAHARFAGQRAPSHGRVTALAVTALDRSAGEATVLASVRIFTEPAGDAAQGTEQRKRYEVGMQRVGGVWKISSLKALAPGGSGP